MCKWILCLLIVVLIALPTIAEAEELKNHAEDCALGESAILRLLGTATCVGVGLFSGFLGHELGHALVGLGDIEWQFDGPEPEWSCPRCSRGRVQTIALGGFAEQILSTEILLNLTVPREHPFIAGALAFNIANSTGYTIRSEIRNGVGDLANFSRTDRRIIEAVITTHALLSGYRLLFKDDRFPLLLQSTGRDLIALFSFRF